MKHLFLIILILFSTLQAAKPLEKVSLQLQWKHQFEFAGFYAAKEKGFYRDAGLDVEFIEFDETINITDSVLSSKANYGLSYSSIIAEYIEGKPIVFVANFFKQSPLVLVTQDNIKTPAQLKGKKIMGISNSIDSITLLSMLDKFDINIADIKTVPTNFNLDDFINKKVDAMSLFTTNELYYLDKKGIKYNIFDPVVYGSKYYDVNLFTSQNELINNPSRVKKIRDASIKGWEYALNNSDEIIEIILKKYNTQNKSREALKFEAKQIESIMLANVYAVGSIDKTRVEMIADSFYQAGFIKTKNIKNIDAFIYQDECNPLNLTKKEQLFIQKHPEIVLGTDKHWKPYVIVDESGKVSGYDNDVLTLINTLSGANFRLKAGEWGEMQQEAKLREIDGLSTGAVLKERKEYLNLSDIYIRIQKMIITSKKNPKGIKSLEDLDGKIVAIHKFNLADVKYAKEFKKSEILLLDSVEDVLKAVTSNRADALFGNAAVVYLANELGYTEIKSVAKLDKSLELVFGVRKDWPEAVSIINKALSYIGEHKLLELKKKWFLQKDEEEFNYKLVALFIGGAIIVIVLIILYKNSNDRKLNIELKRRVNEEVEKSRDKDKMISHQGKLIAMGEMIENIAHQWRQPLSQVNSAVLIIDDLMYQKNYRDPEVEAKLLEIESLTKYMSNTIDDFKNFFDSNKEKKTFILNDAVHNAISILKGTLNSNNINIEFNTYFVYRFCGYQSELQQVVMTILNNAIDVLVQREIESPKIVVDIKKSANHFYITFEDNAGGVDDKIINKIFEPYFTTKHKAQATGLGLYMSKMIIEDSLEGTLEVSNKNQGAEFKICLEAVKS